MSYPKYFKSAAFFVKVVSENCTVCVCTLEGNESVSATPWPEHWDPTHPKYVDRTFDVLEATKDEFMEEYYRVKGKLERIANQ